MICYFISLGKVLLQFVFGIIVWNFIIHDEEQAGVLFILFLWGLYNVLDLIGQFGSIYRSSSNRKIGPDNNENDGEPLF